jgi:hypothetical protein
VEQLMRLAFSALVLCSLAACGSEEAAPTFTRIQKEVFNPSCTFSACHSGGNPAGGMDLTEPAHAKIVDVASTEKPSAKRVVPGDPDSSYLMDKLLDRNLPAAPQGETWTSMPPGGSIEADRIELVRAWIAAGAKND